MAYSVKYRLDYCNGKLQNARLDIEVDGYSGAINQIEATIEPFILKYNSEKGDRSGYFHTTEATIKVYQDDKFNIDDLLTSDETAIRVKFYIENSLYWVGFVLPDFYEVEIGSSPVVTMVATDRIGTLKNQTIKRDNDAIGSYHRMIEKSLAKTGLNLPIQSLINFNLSSEPTRDFLQNTGGQWLRVDDDMEGSVSAYEVIRSILVLANATLFQRNGSWHIQNKLEFENRSATKSIDKINTGGSRMINPPAQEVGVFSEFAGGRKYPNNYNFNSLVGWSAFGGFNARIENREVIGFSNGIPIYGGVSENRSLANNNPVSTENGFQYLYSDGFKVASARSDAVGINFEINITMHQGALALADVYAKRGNEFKLLTKDGFIDAKESDAYSFARLRLRGEGDYNKNKLETTTFSFSGVIEEEDESESSVNEWTVYIRIMGNLDGNTTTFVNFAYVTFDSNIKQQGNIFKVKQGVNFTKNQEIDTTIFGDRIRKGINGYFYNYPNDEKSIQFAKIGNIYESLGLSWITPFDSTPEPLLLHSARQRAIMFSAPHNIINATVEGQFDAYDVYNVCGKKYVMVEAVYDFFRNETQLKIEEVKYDNTEKTDYVYSYFGGENTENIKGVSSISGGGTSSGGGRGLIKEDEEGNYYSEQPFYSLGGLSAFGFSGVGDGNGGGGIINVIDNLTSTSKTDPLSANMGRYLKTLIDNIEVGEGGQVIVDWEAITGKPSTFAPRAHSHIIGDVTGLQSALDGKASLTQLDDKEDKFTKNTAFNKNFGTGLNDVARGNHTHTFASLTSKPTTLAGYGITDGANKVHTHSISDITNLQTTLSNKLETSVFDIHNDDNVRHITEAERTKWDTVVTKADNYVGFYSAPNGFLVKTNIARTENSLLVLHIKGSSYSGHAPINTLVQVYNYIATDSIIQARALNNGYEISEVKVFYYNDLVYFWVPQQVSFMTMTFQLLKREGQVNRVVSVSNSAIPVDGVEKLVTITPTTAWFKNTLTQLSQLTDNIGVATHIANTSNPHSVTKAQVGLSNVDNIQQATKVEFMTQKALFDTMFRKTSTNEIEAKLSLYTLGGLSAYGFSDEGSSGGGGGIVNILSDWAIYDASKSGWALSAGLGVDLNTRKADKTWVESLLEDYVPTDTTYTAGRGLTLTGTQFSTSFDIANYATVTALGGKVDKVAGKSLISDGEITRLAGVTNQTRASLNITNVDNTSDANKPISNAAQTALNSKLATSIFNTHNNDNIRHITGAERTKWDGVVTDFATHITNKANPHSVTTAQIGAVDLTSNQNIGGVKSFTDDSFFRGNIILGQSLNSYIHFSEISGGDGFSLLYDGAGSGDNNFLHITGGIGSVNNQAKHLTIRRDSGNVGIGTTSPSEKLDVIGNIKASGTFTALGGNLTIGDWDLLTEYSGNQFTIKHEGATKMHISTSGSGVVNFNSDLFAEGDITADGSIFSYNDLEVAGDIVCHTTITTPQLELDSNWKVLKTGNELEFQYNNVKKATLTPNGDLIVTGGMTAYQ